MTGLLEIQTDFAAALFGSDATSIAPRVRASGLAAERRVGIYRHHVESSLTDALSAVYPVVLRLVGDDFFRFAARRYLDAHPLRSANLSALGEHLHDFLGRFDPAKGLPYLPDVARLEWACQEVLHGPMAGPLDPRALARVPESHHGRLHFALNPASRLLCSRFPVLRIWAVNQAEHSGDPVVEMKNESMDRLLVTRQGARIEILRLSPGEHTLLDAIARHRPLADAAEQALRTEPGFNLADCLGAHVTRGTIAGFGVHPPCTDEE